MARLSHIEDVEQRNEKQAASDNAAQVEQPTQAAEATVRSETQASELPAEADEEFHGLDSTQPMGTLHKVLIALATVVVAIAIVYIVNCWVHFI